MLEAGLVTYLVAISILTMTPGVDTLVVIRNTTRGGFKDGFLSSFGICLGLFVHATISAVGISVLLLQSAQAFMLLKYAGAAYLIYLGISSLKSAYMAKKLQFIESKEHSFKPWRSLQEGFLSNVLNPKTIVFYMAFLPQFIDPTGSALKQSLFLALLHFIIAMCWQSLLALMVGRAKKALAKPAIKAILDTVGGVVMMALGVKLALEK